MYVYDRVQKNYDEQITMDDLWEDVAIGSNQVQYKKRYAISDSTLYKFRDMYGNKVNKEDISYYLYAVLQSKSYIELYGDNVAKEMPRIPMLDHFTEYVNVGKRLATLHVGYEMPIDPIDYGVHINIQEEDYSVEKMRFPQNGKLVDKSTIVFNPHITISSIPDRAYDYVINGKSAIEWLMERYAVTVDKESKLIDDPNEYGNDKYIFNFLLSVIAVSIQTQDLLDQLPEYKEI